MHDSPAAPERDLTWTESRIPRQQRWLAMGQRGLVVWLTGFSGSGKSTLAVALDKALTESGRRCLILDGDNLRQGLCEDLGFGAADRVENIRRAAQAARLLAEAGVIAICALISPFAAQRELARASCQRAGIGFLEVFVNVPLEVCEQRDPRGLYAKARAGLIAEFTGISSPYEPPQAADVELRTHELSLAHCVEQLRQRVCLESALPMPA